MTPKIVLAVVLAAAAQVRGHRAAAPSHPLLRYRGGKCENRGEHKPVNSVHLAAMKLCSTPGVLTGTGGARKTFLAAARNAEAPSLAQRHIRGIVFGGMDGILTTFALLAAAEGSQHTSSSLTLAIGLSTVLADALSMAAGEYLSAKAEEEFEGGTPAHEAPPLEKGLAMFVAFTLFGCMPLLAYIVSALLGVVSGSSSFMLSTLISACSLFALGGIKSQFGAGIWWYSGLEVTGIGGIAATVAFFTARLIDAKFSGS